MLYKAAFQLKLPQIQKQSANKIQAIYSKVLSLLFYKQTGGSNPASLIKSA